MQSLNACQYVTHFLVILNCSYWLTFDVVCLCYALVLSTNYSAVALGLNLKAVSQPKH